jgi:hypothetical protein
LSSACSPEYGPRRLQRLPISSRGARSGPTGCGSARARQCRSWSKNSQSLRYRDRPPDNASRRASAAPGCLTSAWQLTLHESQRCRAATPSSCSPSAKARRRHGTETWRVAVPAVAGARAAAARADAGRVDWFMLAGRRRRDGSGRDRVAAQDGREHAARRPPTSPLRIGE